jgi:hypothetical protein
MLLLHRCAQVPLHFGDETDVPSMASVTRLGRYVVATVPGVQSMSSVDVFSAHHPGRDSPVVHP